MHLQGDDGSSQSITGAQPTNCKPLNCDYRRACLILLMGIVVGEVRQHLLGKSEFIPFLQLLLNVLLPAACGGADTQVTAYLDFRNGSPLLLVQGSLECSWSGP